VCLAVQGERPMLYCFCARSLRPNNNRRRMITNDQLAGAPDLTLATAEQGWHRSPCDVPHRAKTVKACRENRRKKGSLPHAKLVLTIPGFNHICASLERLSWAQ